MTLFTIVSILIDAVLFSYFIRWLYRAFTEPYCNGFYCQQEGHGAFGYHEGQEERHAPHCEECKHRIHERSCAVCHADKVRAQQLDDYFKSDREAADAFYSSTFYNIRAVYKEFYKWGGR